MKYSFISHLSDLCNLWNLITSKKNKFTYHKKRSVKWYLLDRAFDLGMGTHTKIIVTTPNLNWALAPSVFQGIRELLPTSVDFFKHPVGMIHFLLQNLTLEKILILKSNLCQNNQIKQNYQMEFNKNIYIIKDSTLKQKTVKRCAPSSKLYRCSNTT